MSEHLNPEHPDYSAQPGDTRDCLGRKWIFGRNQYTSYWRSGPKDGTVTCSKDYPGHHLPYTVGGKYFSDFDKAAEVSRSRAKSEYERAKEIVDRYETGDKTSG